MNKQTIFFRVDGNNEIASGHIMRCLSYAHFFKENGHICVFVTASSDMHNIIIANGFIAISLNTDFKKVDEEITQLSKVVSVYKPKLIFVDSYFVTNTYFNALKNFAKVLYLDDVNAFDYEVDFLLNYSIYAETLNYNKANKICFLGTDYLILRDEFKKAKPISINSEIQNIFITTGASDENSFIQDFLAKSEKADSFKKFNYHIIIGRFYKKEDEEFLSFMQQCHSNIFFYKNVLKMSEIMLKCDVAISAGGSTLYELSKLGVPTIALITADNQINNVSTFVSKEIMLFGGDNKSDYILKCENAIEKMTYETRAIMQKNALQIFSSNKLERLIEYVN